MPKIISFGLYKSPQKENPLKVTWESFNSMEKFTRFMVISFFLFILSIPFIVNNQQIFFSRAEDDDTASPPPLNTQPLAEFSSNEILVKVKNEVKGIVTQNAENSGLSSLDQKFKQHKVKRFEKAVKETSKSKKDDDIFRWYKVELDKPQKTLKAKYDINTNILKGEDTEAQDVLSVIEQLKQDPNIEYAEPNFIVKAIQIDPIPTATPSSTLIPTYSPTPTAIISQNLTPTSISGPDPDFSKLWGLHNTGQTGGLPDADIDAPEAWEITIGSENTIVGVIDTGIDYTHPDLAANIWKNTGETPNNGIDDDGNGYVDDYYGCNFINIVNNICGDPMDDVGHGTHVAGTIGAVGDNGIGVKGVAPKVKLMALKFLDADGFGSTVDAIKALTYSQQMGAKIINNSWGGGPNSQALYDAIKSANDSGSVFVAAAGNDSSNNDSFPNYPSSYNLPNVISVAATDYNDQRASFSNYGISSVDIAAPGVNIYSTVRGGKFAYFNGTSMAAPHVTGVAALLLSYRTNFTNEDIRQVLRVSADDVGNPGPDLNTGWGRLNAYHALQIMSVLRVQISSFENMEVIRGSSVEILGTAAGSEFKEYYLEYGQGISPAQWIPIGAIHTTPVVDGLLEVWDTRSLADGAYTLRLIAEDSNNRKFSSEVIVLRAKDMRIGFPKFLNRMDRAPTIVDLDGDGRTEFVVVTMPPLSLSSGLLYVLNFEGKTLTGWPVPVETYGASAVAIGDLDNDGKSEIIVGGGGTFGKIYAFHLIDRDADGYADPVGGFPVRLTTSGSTIQASPTLADINGDGLLDIIIGDFNGTLHLIDGRGNILLSHTALSPRPRSVIRSAAAVADIDGDSRLEIVYRNDSGYVYMLDNDFNALLNWPVKIDEAVDHSSPVLVDLNRDGEMEVIVGSSWSNKIYALDKNGNQMPGWPITITGVPLPGSGSGNRYIAVGDLNFDEAPEIVTNGSGIRGLFAWYSDGRPVLGWPVAQDIENWFDGPVTIANIHGDESPEVIAGNLNSKIYAYQSDGMIVESWPKSTATSMYAGNAIQIADLENDGKVDLVTGVNDGWYSGAIVAWNLDFKLSKNDWPLFLHDPQHTGAYVSPTLTPTPNSAPTIDPIGPQTVNEGGLLKLKVVAIDSDGDKITFQSSSLPQGSYFVPLGDVNLDGIVTDSDASLVGQHIVGSALLNSLQQTVADTDHDNSINAVDSVAILQIAKGIFAPNEYWFLWQPTFSQAGAYPITITVSDGVLSDSESVEITVNNVSLSDLIIEDIYQGGKESGMSSDYVYMRYKNIGEQGTGDFFIELSTQEVTIDPVLGFPVPVPNESVRTRGVNISKLKLSPGETQEITAEIDSGKTIQERDENNNIFRKTVTIILPTVAITEPALDSNVSFSGFLFKGTAKANPSSLASVSQVRVRVYDYARSAFTLTNASANYNITTKEWSFDIPPSAITSGSEARLEVRAKDSQNNWSDWKKRKVNVSAQ